jgi:hypothetical protein
MNAIRRGKKFCSRAFTMGRRRWITPTRVGGQVWAGVSTGIFVFGGFLVIFLVGMEEPTTTTTRPSSSKNIAHITGNFCSLFLLCGAHLDFRFLLLLSSQSFARKTCSRTTFFPSSPTFKILCSTSCRNVLFMTSGRNTAESVLPLPSTTSAPLS